VRVMRIPASPDELSADWLTSVLSAQGWGPCRVESFATEMFGGRYGALISFELKDSNATFKVLDALRVVTLSTHLSDNRTLAIPVANTIFFELGEPGRMEMGISPGLVRLSVGIEDIEDLTADFAQALGRSGAG